MASNAPICPYCNQTSKLVGGAVIYPHRIDLVDKRFWDCRPCDAYVGCHPPHGKRKKIVDLPLGRLANAELRKHKRAAHNAFDPLWRDRAFQNRSSAYAWLSEKLDLPKDDTHIGQFDVDTCKRVVQVCREFRKTVLA
jgi:hypothetical protein